MWPKSRRRLFCSNSRDEIKGAAAALAVFTVFIVLSVLLAAHTFSQGYRRELSILHQAMAVDTTKAVASSVQTELNNALRTVIQASVYESGKEGENKQQVEERIREYFNERIENGWYYSNFKSIEVPLTDENSLHLEWLPDGGLRAYGFLAAEFEHVSGVRAFGIKLDAGVVPRYGRLYHIGHRVYEQVQSVGDVEEFENELNENFACEQLSFEIERGGGSIRVTVIDNYGGRAIAGD